MLENNYKQQHLYNTFIHLNKESLIILTNKTKLCPNNKDKLTTSQTMKSTRICSKMLDENIKASPASLHNKKGEPEVYFTWASTGPKSQNYIPDLHCNVQEQCNNFQHSHAPKHKKISTKYPKWPKIEDAVSRNNKTSWNFEYHNGKKRKKNSAFFILSVDFSNWVSTQEEVNRTQLPTQFTYYL